MSLFAGDRPRTPRQFGRIFPPDPAWLLRQPFEPVLDPTLPIVDCHHHLWNVEGNRYLLEELAPDLHSGHNVVATVYMESQERYRETGPPELRPVGETEFVAGLTADGGACGPTRVARGIVGFADLSLGARVQPVLEAQIAAGAGRLTGIRYATAWDASAVIGNSFGITAAQVLRRADVRAGLGRLAPLGLAFDAWVFHPQLPEVAEVARANPALTVVLGHTGGVLGYGPYTGQHDAVFAAWKRAMIDLSKLPNVVVKLGGMLMRLAAFDYLAQAAPPSSHELAAYWRPYMETCIEAFGADRCMFESNFPVEKMGTNYASLWNAFKRIAQGASEGEKQSLFGATARRVYRLD